MTLYDDQSFPQGGGFSPTPQETPKGKKSGPTRKVASTNRLIGVSLLVLAVILAFGTFYTLSHKKQTYVVVAAQPINALTPFSISEMKAVAAPASAIQPTSITASSPEAALQNAQYILKNTLSQTPLSLNQQVTQTNFAKSIAEPTPLLPNQRLIAIQADVSSALTGIQVGNTVDVVAVGTGSGGAAVANVVLPDVQVVSIGPPLSTIQNTASSANSTSSKSLPAQSLGGTYVLRVNDSEVNTAAIVNSTASDIYLVYRGTNADNPVWSPESLAQALCPNQGC